jgi:nucleoside-diphosphate kinase
VALVLSGENVIEKVRRINGKTDPAQAEAGSIRNIFGTNITMNAVHGSANPIDAKREIEIWFN